MKTKNHIDVQIDKNAIVDENDGNIRFEPHLILSDESEQVNGTRYDHTTTDLSRYTNEVFADHGGMMGYQMDKLIGTAYGVAKQGDQLIAKGVKFALKSPAGRLVYDLVRTGHARNVSIGTLGPEPDEEGVYRDHELSEFSFVGLGNNRNAKLQEIALNSLQQSEKEGLGDTAKLQEFFAKQSPGKDDRKEKITNTKEVPVMDPKEKEEAQKALQEATVRAEKAEKEAEEATKKLNQVNEDADAEAKKQAEADKAEAAKLEAEIEKKKAEEGASNAIAEAVKNGIEEAMKPVKEELEEVKKNAFDKGAQAPSWKSKDGEDDDQKGAPATNSSPFSGVDAGKLTQQQLQSFLDMKDGDAEAAAKLKAINEYHMSGIKSLVKNDKNFAERLGVKQNAISIGDFGNFVTSPELLTDIVGYRSDFSEVLRAFPYQQTNSLEMGWLVRNGDISMDDVEFCDDGADGNLKPISDYEATAKSSKLQEVAAVTPVCNAATIFLAADLLSDVAQGYRTDYDRKLAQLAVARLEQAIESADSPEVNSVSFDADGNDTAAEKLSAIRRAVYSISQGDGVLLMSEASLGLIWDLLVQVGQGGALTDTLVGGQPTRRLWGKTIVTAPNELLPTLDDNTSYKTFSVRPLAGTAPVNVTINHAIFYVNPSANWKGRQNGGLRYDLATQAAYEQGGVVKSAFQRNEILLRGSMFRGGAIADPSRIAGVRAENVIS